MVMGDSTEPPTADDRVAVLTRRGGVVWSLGRRRVTLSRPCAIDRTGVTLYRWPMRSVFVPLERVDRFDVVWEQSESDGEGSVERLMLLTRDRKMVPVQAVASQWLSGRHGLPLRARAQQLNNHILPTWRTARPADGEHPPTRS
jgi:hypothetical protein